LLDAQIESARADGQRLYTAGGGISNSLSLAQLTAWCDGAFGPHSPEPDACERPYDVPWVAMASGEAERDFGWRVETPILSILDEIAAHARRNPDWLERSGL
jgi:CDP-paratose 2-epimerase